MDLDRLERGLNEKIKELYFAKFPGDGVENDVPDFEAKMARLCHVRYLIRGSRKYEFLGHREWTKRRQRVIDDCEEARAVLKTLRKLIDDGRRFTAIDVERTNDGAILQEVGITHFQAGKMLSMNLRVAGVPKRRNNFAFGDSEVLELDVLRERVVRETQDSDQYVGHNLGVDFDLLKKNGIFIPTRPVIDTMRVSPAVPHLRDASLVNLATYFGIAADRPHSGGNDARYNMELVLAMVEAYGTYDA
jgi:hypothetical protein